jgi:hypothetical protein
LFGNGTVQCPAVEPFTPGTGNIGSCDLERGSDAVVEIEYALKPDLDEWSNVG